MIEYYFYIYPRARICELFPALKNSIDKKYFDYNECGIRCGWNPEMVRYTNQICKITDHEVSKESKTVHLECTCYTYDIRLGNILEVDTGKTENCYFLNQTGNRYEISTYHSWNTIGGIVNRPPPPKKNNWLATLLRKRKENVYGNMATGNGT